MPNEKLTYADIKQQVIDEIAQALAVYSKKNQYGFSDIPVHAHTGTDTTQIAFTNLLDKRFFIVAHLAGALAQTASQYGVVYIANKPCNIISITEVHNVAGTAGGSVTLNVEKLTLTQNLDAGVELLASPFDLKGTANTVQYGSMTTVLSSKQMAKGDRLALKDAGTLTTLSDVCVIIELSY